MALGPTEIGGIILLFMLLFGAERLPKLARSMGQAKGEFQEGLMDAKDPARRTEEDLDREGRTEENAVAEAAEAAGIETEGQPVEDVEAAVSSESDED